MFQLTLWQITTKIASPREGAKCTCKPYYEKTSLKGHMSQPKTHISFVDSPWHTIHLQTPPPQEEAAPEDPSLGPGLARPPQPGGAISL